MSGARTDKWAKDHQSPFWKPAEPMFTPDPVGTFAQQYEVLDTHSPVDCYVPLLSPMTHGVELVASSAAPLTEEALAEYLGTPPKPKPATKVQVFSYFGLPSTSYITYDEAFSWSAVQAHVYKVMMSSYSHALIYGDGAVGTPQGFITSNTMMWSSGAVGSSPGHVDGYTVTNSLQKVLPGVIERVPHPITGQSYRVQDIIPNLNDHYRWSRAQIADWPDTLDVDLTFQSPQMEESTP